uniref:Uncharacterized protein n=1 Tax=uncultured marine virus TaxID=186617 RepID=A0A0F7L9I5_9VIRU|nr:hypothetical protein [uncultured marine virus]
MSVDVAQGECVHVVSPWRSIPPLRQTLPSLAYQVKREFRYSAKSGRSLHVLVALDPGPSSTTPRQDRRRRAREANSTLSPMLSATSADVRQPPRCMSHSRVRWSASRIFIRTPPCPQTAGSGLPTA